MYLYTIYTCYIRMLLCSGMSVHLLVYAYHGFPPVAFQAEAWACVAVPVYGAKSRQGGHWAHFVEVLTGFGQKAAEQGIRHVLPASCSTSV